MTVVCSITSAQESRTSPLYNLNQSEGRVGQFTRLDLISRVKMLASMRLMANQRKFAPMDRP